MAKRDSSKNDNIKKMDFDKEETLKIALSQIEKQFGAGSVMRMGDKPKTEIEVYSTGAISLDYALGIGGIPRGRIIEIYGPESSGKTTLALHIIAEAQKKGGKAVYIDAEHALDPEYARRIGVDVDNMFLSQPDYGEQALEIVETLIRSGSIDIVVVDSVAALTPKAEIEGEMSDSSIGLQARLMSKAMRKLTSISARSNCTVIFINQLRTKIGVMFGSPEVTTGGNALKFYSSIRIDIRRKEKITKGDTIIGHTVLTKVVKNKMAPPFKEANFDIIFPDGISKESALIDTAISMGILERSGAWFRMGEKQLAQGKDSMKELLKEDKALYSDIEAKVREKF
jgi:recombination protein RecA